MVRNKNTLHTILIQQQRHVQQYVSDDNNVKNTCHCRFVSLIFLYSPASMMNDMYCSIHTHDNVSSI